MSLMDRMPILLSWYSWRDCTWSGLPAYIPGLRRLPEFLGVYRLIWREHYREVRATMAAEGEHVETPSPSP